MLLAYKWGVKGEILRWGKVGMGQESPGRSNYSVVYPSVANCISRNSVKPVLSRGQLCPFFKNSTVENQIFVPKQILK